MTRLTRLTPALKNLLSTAFLLLFFCSALLAQETDADYIKANYDKREVYIPMRDGVKLYTAIYSPKDKSQDYPILMKRTCYSIDPYGEDKYPERLGPNPWLMRDGYIFVYQDVRGRYMSEGTFDNMRPHVPGNNPKKKGDIDESSDTWDTIDWLVKNLKNTNKKVGQWGISYPGFYTAAALPEAHPALVASSPQAPISDFFFDDFHHMGAFLQSYLYAFPVFGYQSGGPTKEAWYEDAWYDLVAKGNRNDAYGFHMGLGPLKTITEEVYQNDFFWRQHVEHPNYDSFWQKRSILPHLKDIDHAVMTVGGWFDAEDLYGPLNIYKTIEKNNPKAKNTIVMGPWSHGDWSRENGMQAVNHIWFGDSISSFYQEQVEYPFFTYHLKGKGGLNLPEAFVFDTGLKTWRSFDAWPPKEIPAVKLGFAPGGKLLIDEEGKESDTFSYISDPANPVPHRSEIVPLSFTPRAYMTDDQRHASRRPDVITFSTEVLTQDRTLAGEIAAKLKVMLSSTDADFVVKLIDVYPDTEQANPATPEHVIMAGYQQLVRAEVFRGRFRNSFAEPEPFTPGEVTEVDFPLQDILHTFKAGHRIMIQIHSTWFPYIDRNPQKYVPNIFEANEEDFIKAEITVIGNSEVIVGAREDDRILLFEE